MPISPETLTEIIDLLLPLSADTPARAALISHAFGSDERSKAIRRRITYEGSAEVFLSALVQHLDDYGTFEPGKTALWQIMESARESMGFDNQTRVDALRSLLNPVEPMRSTETAERDPQKRNPYKGLQAFTSADTRYFFGRDALIAELAGALNEQERFLAVLGASGSGKSSVVMAGLLPHLVKSHPDWTFLERIVPGAHPLENLAQSLTKSIPGSLTPAIQRELESENALRSLHLLAGQINPKRVVLFVDQFEELFTLTTNEAERSRFIALLITAATETRGSLLVVLTVRADFMDRPLVYPDLAHLIKHHIVFVTPIQESELRDLILRPAALQGLIFEGNLVEDLLLEVHGEAGALPLLEFTLEQLYERRDGQRLTRAAYSEIGGVRGALAGQAERAYLALSDEQRRLARVMFLRLIEPGANKQDTTRRRVTRADLTLSDSTHTEILRGVAAQFVNARLLVSDEDTVEVAHEALIREWERLTLWLADAQDDLRMQHKINDDAADWVRAGCPADYGGFYAGTLLVDAQRWMRDNEASLDEKTFIERSSEVLVQRSAKDLRIASQVQRLQRVQFFIGAAITTLIVVLLASFIVGGNLAGQAGAAQTQVADANATLLPIPNTLAAAAGEVETSNADATYAAGLFNEVLNDTNTQVAVFDTAQAEARTSIASANATLSPIPGTLTTVAEDITEGQAQLRDVESQRIAALGEILLAKPDGNDETAALLGIRALRHANTQAAWDIMNASISQSNYRLNILTGHTDSVLGALQLSDDRLLSWSSDKILRLWAADGTPGPILQGHTGGVRGALQLSDGHILSWSDDNTLRLWAADGTPGPILQGHTGGVRGALELSDSRILSWSYDRTLRLWAADGTPGPILEGHTDSILGALELSDGRILSWSDDGTVRVWATDGAPGFVFEKNVNEILELSDGRFLSWMTRTLGTDNADYALRLWAADGTPGPILEGHIGGVRGALELSDGRILSWSNDSTLRLWDTNGTPGPILEDHIGTVEGALELSNGRILSWAVDGTLRVWAADGTPGPVLTGLTQAVWRVMELSDGRILSWIPRSFYTDNTDYTLRLWTIDGTPGPVLEGHTGPILGVLELSDGRILSWAEDDTLRLWAVHSTSTTVLKGHTDEVLGASELSDGRILSWAGGIYSPDYTLRLWTSNGTLRTVLKGHTSGVSNALELSDNRILSWAAGSFSKDHTLRLWAADGTPGPILQGHTRAVWGAEELSDGRILSWSVDDTLRLWAADGTPGPILQGHTDGVYDAQELSNGRILSWSFDDTLRLWAADGTPGPILKGHTDNVLGALDPADGRILSWSDDSTLRLWDTDGTSGPILQGHTGAVRGALELSDGRILSWSDDSTLRLWDADGTPGPILQGHTGAVRGALQLSDGNILSQSHDSTLRLWDADGTPGPILKGHTDSVLGALELSNGNILSWSYDRTLRLWDADGTPGLILKGHTDGVWGALELSDGHILSWSDDETLRIWYLDKNDVLAFACTRVFRDFTAEERTEFGLDNSPTCPKFAGEH